MVNKNINANSLIDNSQITCRICNATFENNYRFGLHLLDEHMPNKKRPPYNCPVCKKKYSYDNRYGLALHWYQEHHIKHP